MPRLNSKSTRPYRGAYVKPLYIFICVIIVTAAARLRPETREEALEAARRHQDATGREPGCHEYRFWLSIDDPDGLLVFERWEDQAALEAHLAAPHVREFGAAIAKYADGPVTVTRYEVADAGPLR
jgi:quinol monooxygenase YgiN